MVHLVDEQTGLCVVCQRRKLACLREQQKYNKPKYDLRKKNVLKITEKINNLSLRRVINNNYVQYDDKHSNFYDFEDKNKKIVLTKKFEAYEHAGQPQTSEVLYSFPNVDVVFKEDVPETKWLVYEEQKEKKDKVKLFDQRYNSSVVMTKHQMEYNPVVFQISKK